MLSETLENPREVFRDSLPGLQNENQKLPEGYRFGMFIE